MATFTRLFLIALATPIMGWLIVVLWNSIKKIHIRHKQKKRNTDARRQRKGDKEEKAVRKQLSLLDEKEYKVYHNLLFKCHDGMTFQVDHIVLCRTGIYFIETKSHGGKIMQDANDNWKQVWFKYIFPFYSPLKQNEKHIRSFMYRMFIKDRSLFKSIVVFPDTTELFLQPRAPVVHCKDLCRVIEGEALHVLTYEDMERIGKKITEANVYSRKEIKSHNKRVQAAYAGKYAYQG